MSLNCRRWLITLLRSVNWQRRCFKRIIMRPKILKLRRNSWTEAVAVLPCVWTEGETSFWRHWGFIRVPERYGIMIALMYFFKWQWIHAIRLESTVFSQYHWQLLKLFRHLKCMLLGSLAMRAQRFSYFRAHRLRKRWNKFVKRNWSHTSHNL